MDTINYVLYNTLIMISPITPFVAEGIYIDRYKCKESIFLEDWPKVKKGLVNEALEGEFAILQEAITALLNSREKSNVKLRWPIANATVEVNDDAVESALLKLSGLVEEYVNAKRLVVKRMDALKKEIRPVFTKLGPEFKENAPAIAEALKAEDADKVSGEVNRSGHYNLQTASGTFNIRPEHFNIVETLENENAIKFSHGIAYVDKEISKELLEEAMVREFERRVQMARKEALLKKVDKIRLFYEVDAALSETIKRNLKEIKRHVNASEMREGIKDRSAAKEYEMDEEKVALSLEKVEK
jgi:isoleucyl-tRNA synthetase